jgi:hypothetical protein
VKRIICIGVFAFFFGGIVSSYGDVQNIRLGGELRVRGYYLANASDNNDGSAAFVTQRTAVIMEADLTDHVFVKISLQGESLWGGFDEPINSAGPGSFINDRINKRFDIGVTEAFVQLNDMAGTPVSTKIGRQYMTYGRGLIISSWDNSYNYDAAKVMLDFYPTVIDLVYSRAYQLGMFGPNRQMIDGTPLSSTGIDMLFANIRHSFDNSFLRTVELYGGWLPHGNITGAPTVPPSNPYGTFPGRAAQPWIVGARADLKPVDNLSIWVEGVYEGGDPGNDATDYITAFMANAGLKYVWKDVRFTPSVNANYIYASGSGSDPYKNFIPWFDYVDGHNGYLFSPQLSNIQVINAGLTINPSKNTSFSVQGYYYLKASAAAAAGTNPNYDFGGMGFTTWDPTNPGSESELGTEIDAIFGYDYSKDVRFQLVYGIFIPGLNYTQQGYNTCANEVRGEINVIF